MKPLPGKFLELNTRLFNYRLSRAKLVVENLFGILAARWRILHTPIPPDLEVTKLIVHAAVILHNFLIVKKDSNVTGDTIRSDGDIQSGNWREGTQEHFSQFSRQGSNNYAYESGEVRKKFMEYFNSENGAVSWQLERVTRL
jgi:hypothetical protein